MLLKNFNIFVFFFLIFNLQAKNTLLKCGKNQFKIKEPVVGFDKFFIKKQEKWHRLKELDNNENDYTVSNIISFQERCSNEKCKVAIIIDKTLIGDRHLNYKIIASSDFCKIDGFDIDKFLIQEEAYNCFKRAQSKSLEKGYCEVLQN